MRDEYDFSGGVKNPYVKPQKATGTIRLDKARVGNPISSPPQGYQEEPVQGRSQAALQRRLFSRL